MTPKYTSSVGELPGGQHASQRPETQPSDITQHAQRAALRGVSRELPHEGDLVLTTRDFPLSSLRRMARVTQPEGTPRCLSYNRDAHMHTYTDSFSASVTHVGSLRAQ